ncbi:glycoside hydrolase family 3 C-terminal domain-containing protein [Nitrospirillum sp. BR 11752]|uniref:glycoside hydrolase family 3 protein n=1 Tax=Nitrospirillum sp. BR 11752 TaxID=3104293 RepID=UPI002EC6B9A3|nr:glycoside hydrolase family 3 C-terminal domain-containing protein [Nitrospirillum sp. BR 11752]
MTSDAMDVSALSLDDKARLTTGAAMWSTAALPQAGIPPVKMADGPMGIASGRVDERDVSTLTPCGTALAASWDPALVRRVGALVGEEARRLGVQAVLAPNLNLPRSPLAGRAFEMFSEDPWLTGEIGAAWIEGIQSRGVAAVAKHLVCNDSETERNAMDAVVDERTLREVYLLPFERAVSTGVWGILAAYNRVNGTHCVEHPLLLRDIVKGQWGFDGFLVSDWFGTLDTDASAIAGLDLEMPPMTGRFGPALAAAVREGRVAPARVDDAAARVARLAARTHAGVVSPHEDDAPALLTEAAAAGFVLLKNEGALLPLAPRPGLTIAVIGPNALAPCYQGGTFAKIAVRPDALAPLDAIRARYGQDCTVLFEPGVDPQPRLPAMPVTALDGTGRGMTVEYFTSHDLDQAPNRTETRDTNSLTWFHGMDGAPPLDRPGTVRASGLLTPTQDGPHTFHVGGTGPVRLLLDGVEVFRRDDAVPPSDIMGVLKAGEADTVTQALVAGQAVRVVVELRYAPARAHGLWYGVRGPDNPAELLERAVAAASRADTVFLIVGETQDAGVESKDRPDTRLPAGQAELIRRVVAANPNTAVLVNVAHALDLSWAEGVPALMITWYPGEMFGPAIAAVLAGDREPGGRLPLTFAAQDGDYPAYDLTPDEDGRVRYAEGRHIGYRHFAARGLAPCHGLGEGLGYTTFAYGHPVAAPAADGAVTIMVPVRNTGARAGKTVVQVYVTSPEEDGTPPIPRLRAIAPLVLAPGAEATAVLTLDARAFSHWDVGRQGWRTAPGGHAISVGPSLAAARPAHLWQAP